jgi:hypothetical protein
MRYTLLCDDNFHYMDETERTVLGEFESADAAIVAARLVVDRDLSGAYKPGMTAAELFEYYTSFGSDPFIRSDDRSCAFSAWDYARSRCSKICSSQGQRP